MIDPVVILILLYILIIMIMIKIEYRKYKVRTGRDPEVDAFIKKVKASHDKKFNDNFGGHYEY